MFGGTWVLHLQGKRASEACKNGTDIERISGLLSEGTGVRKSGFCEQANEPFGSVIGGEFLD
jgi:hypothetical protein